MPTNAEEIWRRSVVRYNAQNQREMALNWYRYHKDQATSLNEWGKERDAIPEKAAEESRRQPLYDCMGPDARASVARATQDKLMEDAAKRTQNQVEEALKVFADRANAHRRRLEAEVDDLTDIAAGVITQVSLASDDQLYRLAKGAGVIGRC